MKIYVNLSSYSKWIEIEFVCVNPDYPEPTIENQRSLYFALKNLSPQVIPLWQDWGDGQLSLTAIFKKSASTKKTVLKLAKQFDIKVDLEQEVDDDYIDKAILGKHEGQIVE